ncbi:MAG: serine/threonine protein kinase [Gammaproteobacteria bacterium]|nr:serine/threonine protein kinase [Gammaproteobacteria bacterium]
MQKRHKQQALPRGTLVSHYRIDKPIGGGGFSIVYLAFDEKNGDNVAIKEFLPSTEAERGENGLVEPISDDNATAYRQGIKRFFDEAATLAKVNHSNIVRVINVFRANNTVYMVMRHEIGKDLRWYIKRKDGRLGENVIRTIFPPLLLGLREVHNTKLLHLDIKPANIFLRPGGNPLLLDFGAARNAVVDIRQAGPHTLTPGFAPIEQHLGGHVGPWSDLYAIGATMWSCIAGHAPPPSTARREKDTYKPAVREFGREYSRQLLEAIDWCLQFHQLERPQSVQALLDFLNPLRAGETVNDDEGLLARFGLRLPWSE